MTASARCAAWSAAFPMNLLLTIGVKDVDYTLGADGSITVMLSCCSTALAADGCRSAVPINA